MIYLLIRSLPLMAAFGILLLSRWQFIAWKTFPWLFGVSVLVFVASAALIGYKRLALREWIKVIPPVMTFLIAGGAALLVESGLQQLFFSLFVGGLAYLTLELLYLLGHEPSKYPVHGLSRLNLALIPLGMFFLAMTLSGLQAFIRFPFWTSPFFGVIYGVVTFACTAHHASDRDQDRRWVLMGVLVGAHAGILAMLLPLDVIASGVIAALLFALPFRARRYAHEPKPKKQSAIIESSLFLACFLAVILFSRWA
ncbi:MAG: hypothetical protein U0487_01310 [Patescibacteria group bacterium]